MLKIFTIGKKHESWITPGLDRYEKRLTKPWNLEWGLLPHSSLEGVRARQEESERLFARLGSDDFVILLDERGKNLSSPALSETIAAQLDHSRQVMFIIGGAYGVDEKLTERANLIWSLSNLVFPHQLVRLILAEQLYRAQEIAAGRPYHHE